MARTPVFRGRDAAKACRDIYENAGRQLNEYWAENVGRYFNRTSMYRMPINAKGDIIFSKVTKEPRKHLLAQAMRFRYTGDRFYIDMEEILHEGVDYGRFLREGSSDSPGQYIIQYDARSSQGIGIRKGTTNEQWLMWKGDFVEKFDDVMEDVATQVAERGADIIVSAMSEFVKGSHTESRRGGREALRDRAYQKDYTYGDEIR